MMLPLGVVLGYGVGMNRLWRTFRFFVLGAAFVLLGVYLFAFTPWREKLGWMPGYEETRKSGDVVVEAIYRFRAETGLWPEYLEDLAPGYLAERPSPAWNYVLTEAGPALATPTGATRTSVGFDFEAGVWRVAGISDNRVLGAGPGTQGVAGTGTGRSGERLVKELRELDRRIAREPEVMEHRREKATVLRAAGRRGEAEAVVREALLVQGEHFWPHLALAVMDVEGGGGAATRGAASEGGATWGEGPAGMAALEAWTRGHPSFTHFYYLSLAWRMAGERVAAAGALREALKQPAVLGEDDPNVLAFYFFDGARFALQAGEAELALALCEAWEKAIAGTARADRSDLVMRAGAHVALKDVEGAARDLAAWEETGRPAAWCDHVEKLRAAIAGRDTGYVYDPGAAPPPYRVFALPP